MDFAKSVFLTALIYQKIKKKEQNQKELFLQSSPAKCAVTECSLDRTKKAFKEKVMECHWYFRIHQQVQKLSQASQEKKTAKL